MAMRFNPATNQLEDDGTGTGITMFPPKPAHEQAVTTEQRVQGDLSQDAAKNVAVTTGAKQNAQEAAAAVDVAESGVRAKHAGDEVTELERAKAEADRLEAERVRFVEAGRGAAKEEADQIAKSKIAAGRGRADFWKGNATGEVLAAFLRGIDRAASSFRGETGPTGVDRIIEAKIDAHEKALISEWEASKEAHESRKADRAAYEIDLEKRKIHAGVQSAAELKTYAARRDKAIAALGPERAKAFAALAAASDAAAEARIDQRIAQSFDRITKIEETNRTPTGGAGGGGGLTAGQGELAGALTSITTELAKFKDAKVSQEALKTWQNNQTAMAGAEKTAGQGMIGATLVNKLRDFKALPREEFAGIGDADKKAILERKRALDQLAKIMTGAAATDPEVRRREQMWLIQPGDSDEIIANKTQAFYDFVQSRAIGAGAAAPGIQRNVAAVKASGPPPAADWKGVTKTISSGTYERTGPGPNDWKKVSGGAQR